MTQSASCNGYNKASVSRSRLSIVSPNSVCCMSPEMRLPDLYSDKINGMQDVNQWTIARPSPVPNDGTSSSGKVAILNMILGRNEAGFDEVSKEETNIVRAGG